MKPVTPAAQVLIYLALVFLMVGVIAGIYIGHGLSMAEAPWIFVIGSFSPTLAAGVAAAPGGCFTFPCGSYGTVDIPCPFGCSA